MHKCSLCVHFQFQSTFFRRSFFLHFCRSHSRLTEHTKTTLSALGAWPANGSNGRKSKLADEWVQIPKHFLSTLPELVRNCLKNRISAQTKVLRTLFDWQLVAIPTRDIFCKVCCLGKYIEDCLQQHHACSRSYWKNLYYYSYSDIHFFTYWITYTLDFLNLGRWCDHLIFYSLGSVYVVLSVHWMSPMHRGFLTDGYRDKCSNHKLLLPLPPVSTDMTYDKYLQWQRLPLEFEKR